jgi:thiol-disulfide isomerase/thioredoxin
MSDIDDNNIKETNTSNVVPFPVSYDQVTKKRRFFVGCLIGACLFAIYLFKDHFIPKQEEKNQSEQVLTLLDIDFSPFVGDQKLPKGTLKFYKKDDDGKWNFEQKSLAEFVGKPMVIHLWATYCGPCVKELPLYDQFVETTSKDIQHIAVMLGKADPKDVEAFYKQKGIKNLSIVIDEKGITSQAYNIQGIPTTIFVSGSGKPLGFISGIIDWNDTNVITLLKNLLKKH